MSYTAADIRILEPSEVEERFNWAKVGRLAKEYNRPANWIARSLRACDHAGVSHQYFIDRYLCHLSIPKDESVDSAMRELSNQDVIEAISQHPNQN